MFMKKVKSKDASFAFGLGQMFFLQPTMQITDTPFGTADYNSKLHFPLQMQCRWTGRNFFKHFLPSLCAYITTRGKRIQPVSASIVYLKFSDDESSQDLRFNIILLT